jgi:hypothetical protein|tara:strand:+ start:8245 stop:8544 length:300 start_codon:yes stop_codon:yes gene_type:complete
MGDVFRELESRVWTFAKTMPDNPHYWSLKKDWPNAEDFFEAVQFITDNGITKIFKGRDYTVLYHNGFRYWTMDPTVESTTLINRAKIDYTDVENLYANH